MLTLKCTPATGISLKGLLLEVEYGGRKRIHEVPVMRDHQDRTIESNQPTLEPEHCVKVKVIGRFIQQQQVGRSHEDSGQIEAHFPATRE